MKERIELIGGVEIADDVENKIKRVGIRGLDIQKAKELGVFDRISMMLCAFHASVMAGYRIYGCADYLLSELGGRKNEISRACNDFEKAFDRFFKFWTGYYAKDSCQKEVNYEMEALYHNIMEWAQLPEAWNLGDKQRLDNPIEIAIKVDVDGRVLNFHKSAVEQENLAEVKESWCVTKFDMLTGKQESVNTDMDKASAQMVAKRLSTEDTENIYTASLVQEITERRLEVTPMKTFKNSRTIGSIKKILK